MDGIASHACACVFGWQGQVCETEVIPCLGGENNCSSHANCSHVGPGVHACECDLGYSGNGQVCGDVDECASEPCEHGGRCIESSMGLLIVGYVEGASNARLVELFNPTCTAIDLASYRLSMVRNGGAWGETVISLSGSVAGGGSLILCHTGLATSVFSGCDQYSALLDFNGDDALALVRDGDPVGIQPYAKPVALRAVPDV